MSLNMNAIRIDLEKASSGTWGNFAGGKFLIRRYNAKEVETLRNKLVLEKMEQIQMGDEAADATAKQIDNQVLAEAVLIGWEGITETNAEGAEVEVPFSTEKALEFFSDPQLGEFKQFVQTHSYNRGTYTVQTEEKVAETVKTTADS